MYAAWFLFGDNASNQPSQNLHDFRVLASCVLFEKPIEFLLRYLQSNALL